MRKDVGTTVVIFFEAQNGYLKTLFHGTRDMTKQVLKNEIFQTQTFAYPQL